MLCHSLFVCIILISISIIPIFGSVLNLAHANGTATGTAAITAGGSTLLNTTVHNTISTTTSSDVIDTRRLPLAAENDDQIAASIATTFSDCDDADQRASRSNSTDITGSMNCVGGVCTLNPSSSSSAGSSKKYQ